METAAAAIAADVAFIRDVANALDGADSPLDVRALNAADRDRQERGLAREGTELEAHQLDRGRREQGLVGGAFELVVELDRGVAHAPEPGADQDLVAVVGRRALPFAGPLRSTSA